MSRICFGCGAKLQYSNKDSKGYVPENKLNDAKYCMRCFKLMHYGVNINDTVPKRVEEILYLVNSDDKFTIFMCDFLSLSDKIINIYNFSNTVYGYNYNDIGSGNIKGCKITYIFNACTNSYCYGSRR